MASGEVVSAPLARAVAGCDYAARFVRRAVAAVAPSPEPRVRWLRVVGARFSTDRFAAAATRIVRSGRSGYGPSSSRSLAGHDGSGSGVAKQSSDSESCDAA